MTRCVQCGCTELRELAEEDIDSTDFTGFLFNAGWECLGCGEHYYYVVEMDGTDS